MRNTFAQVVTDLAGTKENIVLLSGDIGNRLFDDYKKKYPDRFFNCGVAEAMMTGVAAGLAISGFHPITYTITPFVTTRCLEQIRVDLCYHNLAAVIVGVGSGLCYSSLGPTHHSLEDIAMMRALPNMTVYSPADPVELQRVIELSFDLQGPCYIRLGKKGEPTIHKQRLFFSTGEAVQIFQGKEVVLLSTGCILDTVCRARECLLEQGIDAALYSFPSIKPLDGALLETLFSENSLVVTVEEHSCIGGFGSAVAEWKAKKNLPGRLLMIGTEDQFFDHTGSKGREIAGLVPENIAKRVLSAVGCRL